MDEIISICVVGILLMFAMAIPIAWYLEAKSFNKGKCPKCGHMLRHFDTDSQGGKGFVCDDCGYITWVSFCGGVKVPLEEN